MGDLGMDEDRPFLPSFAVSNPDPNSIRVETWVVAEDPVREVLNCIHPTLDSDEKRKDVIEHVQMLIRCNLRLEVFPYGSVPLKTYLPDGDIDLTLLSTPNVDEILPREVLRVLQEEEKNKTGEFEVKDTQFIDAEVKLVKCLVQDIVIDISFNQLGGLCTLCFLEQVDRLVGKDHLFKRSIILIKAWCYYESRVLGAHHGLISTYALETLVLYIFHVFHASLDGPLQVLYRFLDYYSKFDWDNYIISLDGPISKSSLPNLAAEIPENHGADVLLSGEFRRNCMDMFIVPSKGLETDLRAFAQKHLNIIDPLKENNNLGRSVHKGNYFRIRSALRLGARKLGRILQMPSSNLGDEIKKFFTNTLQRHKPKYGPDTALIYGSKGFGTLSISSLSEPYFEDDTYSRFSNGDFDDYLNDVGSIEANNLPTFQSSGLRNGSDKFDSPPKNGQLGRSHSGRYNDQNTPPSDPVDEKTGLEMWMERGGSQLVDGDTICVCINKNDNDSDSLLSEVRERDATDSIGETEILNPFSDLTGDYDSHIRNLLYSQGCHGYALSAAMVCSSPPTSPYGNNTMWDGGVVSWSVPFSSSHVNANGVMVGGPPAYVNGSTNRGPTNAALRGTGPYIPVMSCTTCKERPAIRGRGRNRVVPVSNGHLNRPPKLAVEVANHAHERSPRQARTNSEPQQASPVNSTANGFANQPRKLEFGSFAESPSNTDYVQSPKFNTKQAR
ncbi:hypothetical protein OSB04_023084 [Centaurea solstitialis]|uniref:Uncharacterized protein n=1 Tax=Centaurea solstitialis TaxID=347529 RepID=A0AA38W1Y4_9ASTR|nr:hypothetical protein OSB04_023084 [Centaurea solstitialis]